MNATLSQVVLLVLFSPVAVCQTAPRPPDCSTLKYLRHKVSCLCGAVEICSGDICGSQSVYDLDDDITVELRTKSGTILDTQKVGFEVSEQQGTKLDGTAITFEQKERRFSFNDKRDGEYLLAFIPHKNGVAQPAVIFPTNYSHKRKTVGNFVYMLERSCPR